MKQTVFSLFFFVFFSSAVRAQDLLESIDFNNETSFVTATFKSPRVINGHSVKNVAAGEMDFRISHRFGELNSGIGDLFGLDVSWVRLGFDFGISPRLNAGFGRSSFEKTLDGYVKYRILRQSTGNKITPLSVSFVSAIEVVTAEFADPNRMNFSSSRYFYTNQLLIARKFNSALSIQLMPTIVHRNLVATRAENNTVFSLGAAFRQKLSNRFTITGEYYYLFPDQVNDQVHPSLSLGVDIDTGGHIFSLHFTNSTSMIYKGFVAETTNDFFDGDIHFGFNISRIFSLKKK